MAGSSRRSCQRCREIEKRPESARKVPSDLERLRGMYLGALVLAFLLVASPLATQAQHAGKVHRIGVLRPLPPNDPPMVAFRQGLRDLGYVDGETLMIEYRSAEGQLERLPELAAELVRLKVDVIVAGGTRATRAAMAATRAIPIVMPAVADPVGEGLVASLARP